MSLKSFIFQECANFNYQKCIDTECFAFKKRCLYFEKCLLPLKDWKKHPNYLDFDKSVAEYISLHKGNNNENKNGFG